MIIGLILVPVANIGKGGVAKSAILSKTRSDWLGPTKHSVVRLGLLIGGRGKDSAVLVVKAANLGHRARSDECGSLVEHAQPFDLGLD